MKRVNETTAHEFDDTASTSFKRKISIQTSPLVTRPFIIRCWTKFFIAPASLGQRDVQSLLPKLNKLSNRMDPKGDNKLRVKSK